MSDPVAGHGITAETYEARRTSFGAGAGEYDRVRPDWPSETLSWLVGEPAEPLAVLDLGAGTGKGTRALADLGHRVTALEPSDGMLDVSVPWVRELHEVSCRPESSSDDQADGEPLDIAGFRAVPPVRRSYVMRISPDDLAVQAGSWSHIAIHPERERILEEIRALGARVSGEDGLIDLPHVTTCFRTEAPA